MFFNKTIHPWYDVIFKIIFVRESIFTMEYNDILVLSLCFFGSLIGTYFVIPKIIGVAKYNHLMDNPNVRSSHTSLVPRLGGVSFYMSFIFGMYLLRSYNSGDITIAMIAGISVLFIIGLKDDLTILTPKTKLIAQFISSLLIMVNPDFQVQTLNNFLGIGDVSVYITFPLAIFFMLYLINSFNLIDGIDGLASTIAIISFFSFGVLFFFVERYFYLGICLIGLGSLFSFLSYNLSKKENKIFMGDTGSMILGYIIAILSMRILSYKMERLSYLPLDTKNLFLLVIAILFVPLFDTGRIFLVRMLKGKSPFQADRNHIHHLLIDYYKISHRRASFYIGGCNLIYIALFYYLSTKYNYWVMSGVMLFTIGALFVFFQMIQTKRAQEVGESQK